MDRPLCLIVNPTAGNGRARALLPEATSLLTQAGADHRVTESASLEHAKELAVQAAERDEVIVAVGGDGMAGALAAVAATEGASYGLIPAGRGNDLARALGIPAQAAAAAKVLSSGTVRRIDLIGASAPDHAEVVVAGSVYAGIPAVAGEIANSTKWPPGPLHYTVAALRALARWQPVTFTVRDAADDAGENFDGYAVVIANSPNFGAGMRVAPPAELDDGELDLVLMRAAPKLAFVRALQKIKDGSHVTLPQITLRRGSDVTITMSRDMPAGADGELLPCAAPLRAGTPMRVRVIPAALSVLAPAQP